MKQNILYVSNISSFSNLKQTRIYSLYLLPLPPSSLLHVGWSPEGERLHLLYVVPVITGDPGQAALSDLNIAESQSDRGPR